MMNQKKSSRSAHAKLLGMLFSILALGVAIPKNAVYGAGSWVFTPNPSSQSFGTTAMSGAYPYAFALGDSWGSIGDVLATAQANRTATASASASASPGMLAQYLGPDGKLMTGPNVNQGVLYQWFVMWSGLNSAAADYQTENGVITPTGSANSKVSLGETVPSNSILPGYLYSTSPTAQTAGSASSMVNTTVNGGKYSESMTELGGAIRGREAFLIFQNGKAVYGANNDVVLGVYMESDSYPSEYYWDNESPQQPISVGLSISASAQVSGGGAAGGGMEYATVQGTSFPSDTAP